MSRKNTYYVVGTLPTGEKFEEFLESKTNRSNKVVHQVNNALWNKYKLELKDLKEVNIGKICNI